MLLNGHYFSLISALLLSLSTAVYSSEAASSKRERPDAFRAHKAIISGDMTDSQESLFGYITGKNGILDYNLDSIDKDGNTLLHLAVLNKLTEVTKELLMQWVNTSIQNNDGDTALHIAIKSVDEATVRVFIETPKACPTLGSLLDDCNRDGETPLLAAEKGGERTLKIFNLLGENGAALTPK